MLEPLHDRIHLSLGGGVDANLEDVVPLLRLRGAARADEHPGDKRRGHAHRDDD